MEKAYVPVDAKANEDGVGGGGGGGGDESLKRRRKNPIALRLVECCRSGDTGSVGGELEAEANPPMVDGVSKVDENADDEFAEWSLVDGDVNAEVAEPEAGADDHVGVETLVEPTVDDPVCTEAVGFKLPALDGWLFCEAKSPFVARDE